MSDDAATFDPLTATGLELIQALIDGKLPPPSMGVTMNFRPGGAEVGKVWGTATPDERHLNPAGMVHGGYVATLLDTLTGIACHTTLGPGDFYATTDLTVKMIRPATPGVPLRGEGRVINAGRRLLIADGEITNPDGKIVAHGVASCMATRAS